MVKKILIILSFMVVVGARHAVPLQGLLLSPDMAFADVPLSQQADPCPPECVVDTMEIVTWYPSPYNEYEELRLYPTQRDDNYCDNDKIGLMYYDHGGTPSFPDNDKMMICKGTLLGWQEVGGEGYWELSGNAIYNNNSGNVGIGKANPQAKLDVEGKIRMGSQTVDADSQDTVVTKGYLASYVTAALANSSNSLKVTGNNPSCPSGYTMTSKNWTSVCCSYLNQCCPPRPDCFAQCWTGGGWKSASDPAPTCTYYAGDYYLPCTSSSWSEVLCIK